MTLGKIGVALVGTGWMGGALLRRLAARDDAAVCCIVETDTERGRAAAAAAGRPDTPVLDRYEAALARPDVQAVVLASPNAFHAPQALAALAAGKHVFCEKPCATTYADHLALVAADRRYPELTTFTDYILHFDPMETRLREMVTAGAFGKIVQLQVNYRNPVNIAGDKAWKLQKVLMGDAFGMAIIHALSVIHGLMQAQGDAPMEVMATAMPAQRRPIEAEPIWNVLIRFASGATGICLGNIDFGNGYDAYHNLSGTHGGFVFESLADRPQKVRYWSERDTHGQWLWPFDTARCASQGLAGLAWPAWPGRPTSAPRTRPMFLNSSPAPAWRIFWNASGRGKNPRSALPPPRALPISAGPPRSPPSSAAPFPCPWTNPSPGSCCRTDWGKFCE